MNSTDDALLLHAALDGELDAAGMLRFETALARNEALAGAYARGQALRRAVRREIGRKAAPPALRAKVAALAPRAAAERQRPNWRALAAAALLGASLAGPVVFLATRPNVPQASATLERLIDGHRRALLSGQPFDVASNDRHTVKPWFSGRFALAPQIADLAPQGFDLAGGRIDVVGGSPAATLVYRHKEHLISLTALPALGAAPAAEAATSEGYSTVSWREGGVDYWAISDIDRTELEAFQRSFEAAIRASGRGAAESREP